MPAFVRFGALALALFASPALAQDYPDRPVKIIVPFPAGGTADAVPRLVADWLSRKWGQPVVIEIAPAPPAISGRNSSIARRPTATR